ncbi:MAG: prepilin-type N-terminal cleavage/methylation domain-containing protein [Clostridia bacterium]|nr:prepilin-type N-terminal cleavage/methylation domain-containing protein [Clostridia bacterium]
MPTTRRKGDKGFTLVEIIISVGVLCLVCVLIMRLFILSGEVRNKAYDKEMASVKASNAVEAFRISRVPGAIGENTIDSDSLDIEKNGDAIIARQYFNGDWNLPQPGEELVFVVTTVVSPVREAIVTYGSITKNGSNPKINISGLYSIKSTAGYIDTGNENGGILAEYGTMKNYVFGEGP